MAISISLDLWTINPLTEIRELLELRSPREQGALKYESELRRGRTACPIR